MPNKRNSSISALEQAIESALANGVSADEITKMVAAQQPQTLNELAQRMGEDAGTDDLPIYTVAPPGLIDIATAVREHGVKTGTVKGWIHRGVVPVLGKVRGLGGTRYLVCEETVKRLAKMPKNQRGKTP